MQTAALWEIGLTNVYRSRSAREPFQHRGSRGVARESFLSRPRLGFRDLVPKVAAKRSPIERGRAIRKQRILQQPCTLFSLSLSLSLSLTKGAFRDNNKGQLRRKDFNGESTFCSRLFAAIHATRRP